MNRTAIYGLVALFILALFTIGAFFLGKETADDNSSSAGSSSASDNPLAEFSAEVTATNTISGATYTMKVYSNLKLTDEEGSTTIQSWTLEALTEYSDDGGDYQDILKDGRLYGLARQDGADDFEVVSCQELPPENIVNQNEGTFVPVELVVPDGKDAPRDGSPGARECRGCQLWRIVLGPNVLMLSTLNGIPVFVDGDGLSVTVESFTTAQRTFEVEAPAIAGACKPSTFNPPEDDPPRHNDTLSSYEFDPLDVVGRACQSSWIGDGWCDATNNNAACNWDGGDCCPGTCWGGRTYACGHAGFSCSAAQKAALGKPCLFLHGFNNRGDGDVFKNNVQHEVNWGDMNSILEGVCSSVEYSAHETTLHGWNWPSLQDSYYNKAKQVYSAGGIVFSHSMANNILSGACLNNAARCDIEWVDVGGPVRGSEAADFALDFGFGLLGWAGQFFGLVDGPEDGVHSLQVDYRVGHYASASLKEQLGARIHQNDLVPHHVCGTSSFGTGGFIGTGLAAVDQAVWGLFNSETTDGVVHQDSCRRWGFKRVITITEKCNWWCLFWCDMCTRQQDQWILYDQGPQPNSNNPSVVNNFQTSSSHSHFLCGGNHLDITLQNGNPGGCALTDWYRRISNDGVF